ncbi:MAG: hypothetical protein ABSD81_01370 [Methanomicrobiales archaeon]
MLDPPSPKDQAQEAGDPLEVSVNWTVSGAVPDVGVPVKDATGAGIAVVGTAVVVVTGTVVVVVVATVVAVVVGTVVVVVVATVVAVVVGTAVVVVTGTVVVEVVATVVAVVVGTAVVVVTGTVVVAVVATVVAVVVGTVVAVVAGVAFWSSARTGSERSAIKARKRRHVKIFVMRISFCIVEWTYPGFYPGVAPGPGRCLEALKWNPSASESSCVVTPSCSAA